jgi:hypothetical protein
MTSEYKTFEEFKKENAKGKSKKEAREMYQEYLFNQDFCSGAVSKQPINHSRVYVAKSKIPNAGRGVFAKNDIKKGEIIGFYDGDRYEVKEILGKTFLLINGKWEHLTFKQRNYSVVLPDGKSLVGFSEVRNRNGIGQLVNDFAKPKYPLVSQLSKNIGYNGEVGYSLKKSRFDAIEKEYVLKSFEGMNVCFINDTGKMVAFRDISQGEELYYRYGVWYWLPEDYGFLYIVAG